LDFPLFVLIGREKDALGRIGESMKTAVSARDESGVGGMKTDESDRDENEDGWGKY
jgi:hypothetical protein